MKQIEEIGLIEPLLQELRIRRVLPDIKKGSILVDIGCGDPPDFLSKVSNMMKSCIGIDIVAKPRKSGNITILRQDLQKKINLSDKSTNAITLLAVLEHMKYPEEIVKECFRILKPGGVLLVTVPSPQNEPLLNFLSLFLLVRREMIHQHENYFMHDNLKKLFKGAGFKTVTVTSFELGFNTFVKAVK